ncbi:SxtJ family membrane protein [Candidatus Pelagibacter sp. HIMB1495]|uniref:SxtJ family membrane protein n=1 Tax=unclassified Candidatus Pelagibacter TaxID=2647897 RepID=UPI003F87B0CF
MKSTDIKLPSNKKFGYFFSGVFFIVFVYFFYNKNSSLSYIFGALTLFFLITSIINANLLLPLNKLWMRFGLLLSVIISPIILGIIFFGLVTPYGLIMSVFGRDELRLKKNKSKSYWIDRNNDPPQTNFKQQF